MIHLAGTKLRVGLGYSTVRPSFDLETYSEAGFEWSEADGKWLKTSTDAKGRGGLPAVGAAVYAQHQTTEILSMVYDLKDGVGPRLWLPGQPLPADFCAHIAAGGEIEAHGAKFELWIWEHVAVPRYGFPPIRPEQLYCSMGKARAWSLPPALADVGDVLGIAHQKDAEGKRLLDKFSVPRKPTKKDPRKRIRPEEDPVDGPRLYSYNARDVLAEDEVSAATPDMPADRRAYWLLDLAINRRGIPVDRAGVENCIVVLEQALERYNTELAELTGGAVKKASEVQRLVGWLAGKGCYVDSLDQEAVEGMLAGLRGRGLDSSDPCLRALEIRQAIGSAAVKKVYALRGQMTAANRVHDLFTVDGARTGRPTGSGPQPTNFPNSGPEVRKCAACGRWHPADRVACPWCFTVRGPLSKAEEWNADAAEDGLLAIATRDLDFVETIWTDALAVMGGCLRSLLCTDEEHEFICSDYSAIEAVVNAMLAGEQWRIDVFRTHGKIYEASAAATFKVPLEEILAHKTETGHHHPLRKKGKVTELALGFLGWIGALRAMGFEDSDDEARELILKWRAASPNIVFLGGGQSCPASTQQWHLAALAAGGATNAGPEWEVSRARADGVPPWKGVPYLHGLEGMAVLAIQNPGVQYPVMRLDGTHSGLTMYVHDDVLYMFLPDGSYIPYHKPRLAPGKDDWRGLQISYEGYNTNPKMGAYGWCVMTTYSGKLLENACQATANRILRHGQHRLEAAGYPVVLHVYDENAAEVPKGFGSVEAFEAEMNVMPPWAAGWPIKAKGGWRGRRYRK